MPEPKKTEPRRGLWTLALVVAGLVAVGIAWRRWGGHSGPVPEPSETTSTNINPTTPPTFVAVTLPDAAALHDLPIDKGVVAEIAELDKQFEDHQGGAGWSRICVMHFSRNRLAYGKAACENGLAMSPSPAVRGELLYAMGLIEEKAGNRELAGTYFEQSLLAAPGSAKAVENSLAELSGMRPPPRPSSTTTPTGPTIPSRLRAP